ncbi:hypothetical protein D1627_09305 [Pontibacter oryzae]|uniref:Uncharacterized protein n=1 Tax=Pontibacter oryzae TaxID=2304593 RepID=A0A399S003_9BACT|nr:hypothetical protein D1627_09305 [Pontibacter oryzae]
MYITPFDNFIFNTFHNKGQAFARRLLIVVNLLMVTDCWLMIVNCWMVELLDCWLLIAGKKNLPLSHTFLTSQPSNFLTSLPPNLSNSLTL